jgi:glycogen debranching enzyme, putative
VKYTNEDINLENGIQKEWIITNGIGGFASSTIIGANTRKYHGLLIAPLTPPARRYLILSKVDESIEIGGKQYNLYTNIGKNYIAKGYEYQTSFEKEEIPTLKYKISDVEITKQICMKYGENTVGILYKIKNGKQPTKLTLAPLMNFRDFHSMSTNHEFKIRQENKGTKLKVIIDNMIQNSIYIKVSEGIYIPHNNDIFRNMFYIEEQKRGFYPEENHAVVGRYEIEIKPNEEKEISFVCSLEENIDELDVKKLIIKEKQRISKILEKTEIDFSEKQDKTEDEEKRQELIKNLVISADTFIAYRPSFRLHTIIAGYPWFLDWGRDSLISFEGLLLKTKRYDIAKEVLKTMMRDIKYGLVPNGYSGFDNRPLYNSVDASLLLFEQIQKYLEYTKDQEFIKEIFEKLEIIIENYKKGIDIDNNNIYLDTDHLIVSGTENTQNTWMDAKVDGVAVTPRNGKAVEINSMWYNSLKIMENICKELRRKQKSKKICRTSKTNKKFF